MTADEKRKLFAIVRAPLHPLIRDAEQTIERAGDVLLAEMRRLEAEIARERRRG